MDVVFARLIFSLYLQNHYILQEFKKHGWKGWGRANHGLRRLPGFGHKDLYIDNTGLHAGIIFRQTYFFGDDWHVKSIMHNYIINTSRIRTRIYGHVGRGGGSFLCSFFPIQGLLILRFSTKAVVNISNMAFEFWRKNRVGIRYRWIIHGDLDNSESYSSNI